MRSEAEAIRDINPNGLIEFSISAMPPEPSRYEGGLTSLYTRRVLPDHSPGERRLSWMRSDVPL